MPIGLDSGVDRGAEAIGSAAAPHWQRHRLIFWPRTTTPLLLMTNGREHAPAVYGKIRVLTGRRAVAPPVARPRRGQPAAAGGLPRPPLDPRELLGQRVPRSLERPQSGRLVDVLRRRLAAGRVPAPRRLQRADAGRAGRRQHDLSQRAGWAHAALRHGRVLRHGPRPRAQGRARNAAAAVRPRGPATDSHASSSPRRCRSWRRSAGPAGRRPRASSGSAPTGPAGPPRRPPNADWPPTTTCSIPACSRRCSACCGS